MLQENIRLSSAVENVHFCTFILLLSLVVTAVTLSKMYKTSKNPALDKLVFSTSFLTNTTMKKIKDKICMNNKLAIVKNAGVKYGTLVLCRLCQVLHEF